MAKESFSGSDFSVAVVGGLIAVPLCDASWHAIVGERETIRGVVGLLCGLPIGIAAFSFHWWKGLLPSAANWTTSQSRRWWPAALAIAMIYVLGPTAYERAVSKWKEPVPIGPIVWNIEDNAKGLGYFLNMMQTEGHELRVLGFQAHGKNISGQPISHFSGYMRSDLTNAQVPIYLQAQDPDTSKVLACFPHPWIPTAPSDTYGIPPFAEFDISTFQKPFVAISATEGVTDGVPLSDFMGSFAPFTVYIEYDGGKLERKFSREEVERQSAILQNTVNAKLNPLGSPHILRKSTAQPSGTEPLQSILPLATPRPNQDTPTGSIPHKN